MNDNQEQLLEAMGEAVSLPPEDPLRRQIEAEIVRQGEWAEGAWMELLTHDESFRLMLRKVDVPANLEATLLSIPELACKSKKKPWFKESWLKAKGKKITSIFSLFWPKSWRGAIRLVGLGMVLVALASLLFFEIRSAKNSLPASLQTLATLAINDHLNNRSVTLHTDKREIFQRTFASFTSFPIFLPMWSPGAHLIGGRPCNFGTHPVIYSLWKRQKQIYSLFQIKLSDFGLAFFHGTYRIKPTNEALNRSPCEALFWTQGDMGFILIADHSRFLQGITPPSLPNS